jgi:hypothetical protein
MAPALSELSSDSDPVMLLDDMDIPQKLEGTVRYLMPRHSARPQFVAFRLPLVRGQRCGLHSPLDPYAISLHLPL